MHTRATDALQNTQGQTTRDFVTNKTVLDTFKEVSLNQPGSF